MIIDHKFLKSLKDVIGGDIKNIIDSYNSMLFEQVSLIEKTITSDLYNAKIHTHTLKGSSANVGAVKLYEHCLKIENLITANQQFKAKELMPELNRLASLTKQAFMAYKK
jgi:HPt (histidine-containing phosphotransfer) domain-containing protein